MARLLALKTALVAYQLTGRNLQDIKELVHDKERCDVKGEAMA